ncbi:MAG: zinc-binding dehydrogenase, partial [Acidobacteria bacterium]|nr:zinc-binding dehydrogenase [Acidobacteriota bacterium]
KNLALPGAEAPLRQAHGNEYALLRDLPWPPSPPPSLFLKAFHPMSDVPTGVKLTSYSGESKDLPLEQFQAYVDQVQSGKLRLKLGPTFSLDEIQMAHRLMDENGAGGKIVVLVD